MRSIPDPGFAGDDGSASPEVVAALTAYAADRSTYTQVLGVLQHARLLVPVVALAAEVEYDERGIAHDKTSDMATVLMQGRDGRMALLAFTAADTLQRWDPEARPVPATLPRVAAAATQDGASAILVDLAGPVRFVLEGQDVAALAEGFTLVEMAGKLAWAKRQLR